MCTMKNVIIKLAFVTLFLTGCSPFGNESLVEQISRVIEAVIPQKTSTAVLSSASSTLTIPAVPAEGEFKVTHSVGDQYQQEVSGTIAVDSTTLLPTGYKVFSSVQGAQVQ